MEWFDRFFTGLYARILPRIFDAAQTAEHCHTVKRLLGVRRGQRVLDLPCGTGRLTLPLARAGIRMTGIDFTENFLRQGRRAARREGLNIRFASGDMRDIDFEGEFDGAFNWFGSFGYFSDRDNLRFCRSVLRALKPGGRFLVEGFNKSWVLAHFRRRGRHTTGGVEVTEYRRWDGRSNRVSSTWILRKGRATERHTIRMRLFNGTELRNLLKSAGFCEIKLFPFPPCGSFSRHSRRLIAVARRPAR